MYTIYELGVITLLKECILSFVTGYDYHGGDKAQAQDHIDVLFLFLLLEDS
jgi:hypothetical protein